MCLFLVSKILIIVLTVAVSSAAMADQIFTIGNSLTWDTKPYDLDGDVDYHVYCSKNLEYIRDNPSGHCVRSSLPWTTALATRDYDWVSVQPFQGTTLEDDIQIISNWMQSQPTATFVIHPGWSAFASFPSDYQRVNTDDLMYPSEAYISDLMLGLKTLHPDRALRSTRTNRLLFDIYLDTQAGIGPFNSLTDLSRDFIHMGSNTGRYLAHNAMRRAMGQPLSTDGFDVDSSIKQYLDEKLTALPVDLIGDYDDDGDVDSDDVDFFGGNLDRGASYFPALDLNGDGIISLSDHNLHVTTLLQTSNGQTGTLIGDIDGDGQVNILGDVFPFVGRLGVDENTGYSRGDLNADQRVDVLEDGFRLVTNLGKSIYGSSIPNVASVPEPNAFLLLVLGTTVLSSGRRRV
jgi:hypothetical protein